MGTINGVFITSYYPSRVVDNGRTGTFIDIDYIIIASLNGSRIVDRQICLPLSFDRIISSCGSSCGDLSIRIIVDGDSTIWGVNQHRLTRGIINFTIIG